MDECKVCANADNEYCFACDNGNQFKPMTNADSIRSMSDEELADFIGAHDCLDCPLNNKDDWCAGSAGSCRGNVLEWLKSPVKQEGEGDV